jgi:hypothetical protein
MWFSLGQLITDCSSQEAGSIDRLALVCGQNLDAIQVKPEDQESCEKEL